MRTRSILVAASASGSLESTETISLTLGTFDASTYRNMRSSATALASVACLLLLAIVHPSARANDAPKQSVWVVTDSRHPVEGRAGVRLIELDAPARLSAELATSLPQDPQQAAAIVRQRLTARHSELQQKFATAYQGVIDAWSLGVSKVPAVIVDRKYVVYGETDIDRAVAKINSYRSAQR